MRLKQHPLLGLPLGNKPPGDLSDCRKVYFDERADVPPRWRIVYRLIPDERAPTKVEIVSIKARRYAEAYVVAVRRLGREQTDPGG